MKRRTNKQKRSTETPKVQEPVDQLQAGPPLRLIPPTPPSLVQEWRIEITPTRAFRVRRNELGFFQTLILGLAFPVSRIENDKPVDRFRKI